MRPSLPSLRLGAALVAASALLLATGVIGGRTASAFSDATGNGGNSFEADPVFACSNPGSVTLNGVRDSWLDGNSANSTFRSDQILELRSQSAGHHMRTIVTFDLPIPPDGCDITDARLWAASHIAGRREWSVTSQVVAGGQHEGWIIRDQNENGTGQGQQVRSRENGTNRPRLVLRYG
jgi:hypothetical protein